MVSGLPSTDDSGGGQPAPATTYTERFYEVLPYYLSIGMTFEQFWDGDPTLPIYYRKAEELRNEQRNQELWLQGMYIYEALCDVAPIIHAFAKKGTRPRPYATAPYSLTDKQREKERIEKVKKEREKGIRYMEAFMLSNNKRFGAKA